MTQPSTKDILFKPNHRRGLGRRAGVFMSLLLMCCLACNTSEKEYKINYTQKDSLVAPAIIPAGGPKITSLDTTTPMYEIAVSRHKDAEVIDPSRFYVTMQNFDTEEGLALGTLLCGLRDSGGTLWFGTSGNGVSRYDGQGFRNYNSSHGLIHNLINTIFQDDRGILWFGTYGGLSRYDGKEFLNYTTNEGLINNNIISLAQDQNGHLWIGTEDGLSRFDGKGFTNFSAEDGLPSDIVLDLFVEDGDLLIATVDGLFLKELQESATTEKAIQPYFSAEEFLREPIAAIHKDGDGLFWLGTDYGVVRFDPKDRERQEPPHKRFTTKDGLINDYILAIYEDDEGLLWFGTEEGISRFDPQEDRMGHRFWSLRTAQGLSYDKVHDIVADRSGSLWFLTGGGGVDKYPGEGVISYSTKEGLDLKTVTAITRDDEENLWLADDAGALGFYEESGMVNQPFDPEINFYFISDLFRDAQDNMWIATYDGAFIYNGKSIAQMTDEQGLLNNAITSIGEDNEGNIWLGTYEGGVNRYDGKTIKGFTTAEGLVHNTVWSILQDSAGYVWFATRDGLSRFDGSTFVNFKKAQGLVENKLSKIIQDNQGNLIIGSWGSGVSYVRAENVAKMTGQRDSLGYTSYFEPFTTAEGLANDVVYDIEEDRAGNIYIGSSKGITVLKGGIDPSGDKIAKNGIENFNLNTGFPIKDISNNHAMFLGKDDVLWAGTGDRLIRFDYSKIKRNEKPPAVFIKEVAVNKATVSWHLLSQTTGKKAVPANSGYVPPLIADELMVYDKNLKNAQRDSILKRYKKIRFDSVRPFYEVPENLELPYNNNTLSFKYVGVETSRPAMVKYQYWLEGFDTTWNPVTKEVSATYGNLPEGDYVFKVRAQNPASAWSEPSRYAFRVLPPWYRSVFAYLVYFLLAVTLVLLVHRFQKKRLLQKERSRTIQRELAQAKEIEKAYAELKSTQAQLIQSEKMASLGELTAGIAHEIQNPLNFVNNFAEVSQELLDEMEEEIEKGDLDEVKFIAADVKQNLEKINHHGKRADSIVKGMLQHSRSSTGKKEPTDINALADEYLRLAYHGLRARDKGFNADSKTDFDGSIPRIKVIPQDIGRVLLNIFNNAFFAVNERKKLSAENYQPFVSVVTKKIADGVEIRIRDNGEGIPKEIQEKIFQPFFTTKPTGEGTGLGLSLSYDIIKTHQGEFFIEKSDSEGTTFRIELPLIE